MKPIRAYRKFLFVFLFLLIAGIWSLTGVVTRAYADCAAPVDESSYRESADLVALGTVEEVDVRSDSSRVEVSVERVFKGESDRTLYVVTQSGSLQATSIDVQFKEDERYLLYLREDGGELTTSICDGTRELTGGSSQLPAGLGDGDAKTVETLPQTGGVAIPGTLLVLVSAVVIGLILRPGRRNL